MISIRVAVKYFWGGSVFYSGIIHHCIALPLEPVPEVMKEYLYDAITPHFRFSNSPWFLKQTISTLPSYVIHPGNDWNVCILMLTEHGFCFKADEVEICLRRSYIPKECPYWKVNKINTIVTEETT